MKRHQRPIAFAMLFVVIVSAPYAALACQPAPEKSIAELFGGSVGVVRARVTSSRVIDVSELGVSCSGLHCDVLELELDISETYKSENGSPARVYTAAPYLCITPVRTGLEYVVFLIRVERLPGVVFASEYSHFTGHRGEPMNSTAVDMIAELRRLASDPSQ